MEAADGTEIDFNNPIFSSTGGATPRSGAGDVKAMKVLLQDNKSLLQKKADSASKPKSFLHEKMMSVDITYGVDPHDDPIHVQHVHDSTYEADINSFQSLHEETMVFGSTEEAEDEEHEQDLRDRARWCGLLHPFTMVSTVYDMGQLAAIIYILVVLPYRLAFDAAPDSTQAVFYIDLVVDISLAFDILLNFFRFYVHMTTGRLMTESTNIRKRYLKSWFLVDLGSVIPFDYVMRLFSASKGTDAAARSTKMLRLAKLARFARLAKLFKLSKLRKLGEVSGVVVRRNRATPSDCGRLLGVLVVLLVICV